MTTLNEDTGRKELTKTVAISISQSLATTRPMIYVDGDGSPVVDVVALAKAIYADGYQKPRIITTVEELDALPVGSVVLDRRGICWQKHDGGNDPLWHAAKHNTFRYNSEALSARLHATVLWEPEAGANR